MIRGHREEPQTLQLLCLEDSLERMKVLVDASLSASPAIIRQYTKHLGASKGKMIRATALLICAQNTDGRIHPDAANLAAAIELLHLATLVHDDVIDNASKRREHETLQEKYGKKTAVICGDYLFCMALKLAAAVSDKQEFLELQLPDYMSRVCLGELNQHLHNGDLDLSPHQYFKIISGKTAALFEAAFYAGAVLCDPHSTELKKYRKLGRYAGMIFQLTDDCMDYETTESAAKKTVRSDYEQGVITLPLIHALGKIHDLKEKCRAGGLSKQAIYSTVITTGGPDFTRAVAKRYYNKAMVTLSELMLTNEKRAGLLSVLDKAFRQ